MGGWVWCQRPAGAAGEIGVGGAGVHRAGVPRRCTPIHHAGVHRYTAQARGTPTEARQMRGRNRVVLDMRCRRAAGMRWIRDRDSVQACCRRSVHMRWIRDRDSVQACCRRSVDMRWIRGRHKCWKLLWTRERDGGKREKQREREE